MSKLTVTLFLVIVGLLSYIFFFNTKADYKDKYEKQKREIDSLNQRIASIRDLQAKQDSIINANKDSILVLSTQIEQEEKKIEDLRKYYGKKIKDINNATPTELSNFFTERYQ